MHCVLFSISSCMCRLRWIVTLASFCSFRHIFLDAWSSATSALRSGKHASRSGDHVPENTRHAPANTRHALANTRRALRECASRSGEHASCSGEHASCSGEHASRLDGRSSPPVMLCHVAVANDDAAEHGRWRGLSTTTHDVQWTVTVCATERDGPWRPVPPAPSLRTSSRSHLIGAEPTPTEKCGDIRHEQCSTQRWRLTVCCGLLWKMSSTEDLIWWSHSLIATGIY